MIILIYEYKVMFKTSGLNFEKENFVGKETGA
jgi:hypothetical protein